MPRLSMLPSMVREVMGQRIRPREPEPDLVMEGAEQVRAYEEAGRVDSVMSAAYLFHTARISQVVANASIVVDLGCGPAVQLAQIAEFNPHAQFRGIDLSETMLSQGRRYLSEKKLPNVTLEAGDITNLSNIENASVDAVISTMALHHLPRIELLHDCFGEISRILKPGGSVYLTDFGRLKSLKSIILMAYLNERRFPHLHLFWLDYERSLRAAFQAKELKEAAVAHLPANVKTYSMFAVPFINVIQTPPLPVAAQLRHRFQAMRRSLPRIYRADLDDMRLFLRLGGLGLDPF
jgi:arsenite methyltransferase